MVITMLIILKKHSCLKVVKDVFFLKDNIEEAYIGTCCAWFSNKGKRIAPVLHWVAVVPSHRNRGCARMLITYVLKYFILF